MRGGPLVEQAKERNKLLLRILRINLKKIRHEAVLEEEENEMSASLQKLGLTMEEALREVSAILR